MGRGEGGAPIKTSGRAHSLRGAGRSGFQTYLVLEMRADWRALNLGARGTLWTWGGTGKKASGPTSLSIPSSTLGVQTGLHTCRNLDSLHWFYPWTPLEFLGIKPGTSNQEVWRPTFPGTLLAQE